MMRTPNLLAALAAVCLLSGCETPTKAYVKQHPELSPEHRKIISSGRIKFGDPVAGMTREQVRLVMGTDPDQFDSINGEDVWIWFKSKAVAMKVESDSDTGGSARDGGGGKHHANDSGTDSGQTEIRPGKVTVFFKGDIATRAEFGGGTL
jgi:hypothetical protein